jgi:ribonuclease R
MLSANTCAADFLVRMKHPGLYRVHEGPTPDRLAKLREFLAGLGLQIGEPGKDPTPQDYQALAKAISARPDAALLQTMMLRSMQQAIYTPFNSGHFGLAYEAYAHYTSPIRRYPDLLNHRAIKALLAGTRYQPQVLTDPAGSADAEDGEEVSVNAVMPAAAAGARRSTRRVVRPGSDATGTADGDSRARADLAPWETLGIVCSVNERRADDATRDVEAWLKCQYMKERVGEQYRGRITGVAPFGIFVTLETLYVEGMVHVSDLGSEYFQFNETSHELRGERTGQRYRLTDEIDVQVSRVNLEGRRIDFRLVSEGSARARSGNDSAAAAEGASGPGGGKRPDAPAGRKAAPGKSPEVREAQAARKASRGAGHSRGFKKAGGGQPARQRKKR